MTITLGYTIFTVADPGEALSFFTEAFDLPQKFLTPEGDYGELDTGATTLAFVRADLAHANLDAAGGFTEMSPNDPPIAGSITLVTEDVAATVARAETAGATTYVEPLEKPWGQTVAYVRGPSGMLIEIATPVGAAEE